MYQGRYTMAQSSAIRKPRVDGKPSMLPKPRRPGSTDRASMEARRPSGAQRSSSAEPMRATMGAASGRSSREASATKLPLKRRSKSAQTPIRSSQYAARPTATPVTPSDERRSRSWKCCMERVIAFVTTRDTRPISNAAWQRAEMARVQEALSVRGGGEGGTLIRPLTIARFVEIVNTLIADLGVRGVKLTNDNYIVKLPHLAKKFLYPAPVSKSWLQSVNTLHAFPHALALIGYFLDLVNLTDMPVNVTDDSLFVEKDELVCLRQEYLHNNWMRFQEPGQNHDDLKAHYLERLKQLLGNDDEKLANLKESIKQVEALLEDEEESAARAAEKRIRERRDALAAAVRAARAERVALRSDGDHERARRADHASALRTLDADIAATTAEIQELKSEVEKQTMTLTERARLLDEVHYAARVTESKQTLVEQIDKMIKTKEIELSLRQKQTLDACVEFKQGLIHLSAQFPELATLAVDEKELMEESCVAAVGGAVERLRGAAAHLAERRAQHTRARTQLVRQRAHDLEEIREEKAKLTAVIEREQQALEAELAEDAREAAEAAAELQRITVAIDALRASETEHDRLQAELELCEKQDHDWRTKLADLHSKIDSLEKLLATQLEIEKQKHVKAVKDMVRSLNERLDAVEAEEERLEQLQKGH